MNDQTQQNQQQPAANPPAGGEGSEAEKYAAMAEELKVLDQGGAPAAGDPNQQQQTPAGGQQQDQNKQQQPDYQQQYQNMQAAMHQERGQRQQFQNDLQGANGKIEHLTKMVDDLLAGKVKPGQNQPADINTNPLAILQELKDWQESQKQDAAQTKEQQEQQRQQQQQHQQFAMTLSQADQRMAQQSPDYYDAVEHIYAQKMAPLLAMNYPEQQARAMIGQELVRDATFALHNGLDPAQTAYNLAVNQFGWKPGQQQQQQGQPAPNQQQQQQGGQNQQAAGKQQLANMQAGNDASSPMGGTGGTPAGGILSASEIADLYDKDPARADKEWERARKAGGLG